MTPTQLVDFAVRVVLILLSTAALRRAYFTSPLTAERRAERQTMAAAAAPYSWSWFWATLFSCPSCLTYWIAAAMTLVVVLVPYLTEDQAILWLPAVLAIGYLINMLDANLLKPRLPDVPMWDFQAEIEQRVQEAQVGAQQDLASRTTRVGDALAYIHTIPDAVPLKTRHDPTATTHGAQDESVLPAHPGT